MGIMCELYPIERSTVEYDPRSLRFFPIVHSFSLRSSSDDDGDRARLTNTWDDDDTGKIIEFNSRFSLVERRQWPILASISRFTSMTYGLH